jgi:hypothetical protein
MRQLSRAHVIEGCNDHSDVCLNIIKSQIFRCLRGDRANFKDQPFYLAGNVLLFLLFLISTKYSGSLVR